MFLRISEHSLLKKQQFLKPFPVYSIALEFVVLHRDLKSYIQSSLTAGLPGCNIWVFGDND